MKFYFERYTYK